MLCYGLTRAVPETISLQGGLMLPAVECLATACAVWLRRPARPAPAVLCPLPARSTGDPLAVALAICLLVGLLCLVLSIPTNNHSWVRLRAGTDVLATCFSCCLSTCCRCGVGQRELARLPGHPSCWSHRPPLARSAAQVDKLWSIVPIYYTW